MSVLGSDPGDPGSGGGGDDDGEFRGVGLSVTADGYDIGSGSGSGSSSSSSSVLGLANMPPVAENATITAENVQNSPILSQVDLNAFNRNN